MLIQKVVQSCGQVLYKDIYVVMYFYLTIGYVCTNIYISGSKPLICIYIHLSLHCGKLNKGRLRCTEII